MIRLALRQSLVLASAWASALHGQDAASPIVVQSGSLSISGSSNVTGWSCRTSRIDASIVVDSTVPREAAVALRTRTVAVRIAVADLDCGNRRMEHDLRKALKGDRYVSAVLERHGDVTPRALHTEARISVAGTTKTMITAIALVDGPDGSTIARGALPLLMTDFNVQPPTGLLGLVRSHNAIVVRFELVLVPSAAAESAPPEGPIVAGVTRRDGR